MTKEEKEFLKEIETFAKERHKGQVDKANKDYFKSHLKVVASKGKNFKEKVVALLHDILEDTETTKEDLEELLRDSKDREDIIEAILLLTKEENFKMKKYKRRIKENDLARQVKIYDLESNMDLSRLKEVTEKDLRRNENYKNFLNFLKN